MSIVDKPKPTKLDWQPIVDPFGKPALMAQTPDGFTAIVAQELSWMAAGTPEQAASLDPSDRRMTAYGVLLDAVVQAYDFAEDVSAAKAMAETLVVGMRASRAPGGKSS